MGFRDMRISGATTETPTKSVYHIYLVYVINADIIATTEPDRIFIFRTVRSVGAKVVK